MKLSLRQKFSFIFISLLVFVTIFSSAFTNYELQRYYRYQIGRQLETQLDAVEYFILYDANLQQPPDPDFYTYISGVAQASGLRLTLIDSLGTVIYDSNVSPDSLFAVENHISRPEVRKALKEGHGSHERTSATINEPLFYSAKTIDHPTIRVIRLAIPLVEINQVLRDVRWKIFIGGGLALLIFGFIGTYLANRIASPILKLSRAAESVKKGNLEAYFIKETQDELGELADVLNEMLSKLRQDLIQMRRLEKVRSQFLGNVSHELRTPIFAVQGYLETMLNDTNCDAETQKKFIAKAYNQAVRLNNLFTDLIDISRIESGEMKLTFTAFNAVKWLKNQVKDLQASANENGIHLSFSNPAGLHKALILGDQERLNQVLVNLVENAIKYNRPQGTVEVGLAPLGDQIEIFIRDSGRGIAEDHLPRIFERFYRVDKERSRAVGGTGLGLAIVKHIIEAHGSQVKVDSWVGEGSTFRFTLKIIKEGRS
ncbi:HAMP domain-containing protein [candidate division KSB1 bacterium]|nr:HAMP domain-containing protein [candidate division KSB1 bacterium]